MRRRTFITLLGGAAAWPLAARAQQQPAPAVGFLHPASPEPFGHIVEGFRRGLNDIGFIDGRNVTIEYRWARGEYDRLQALATELVQQRARVILAGGGEVGALAAKAASATIPILFNTSDDPVKSGLVASFNRPDSNITGTVFISVDLGAKLLGILHELVPKGSLIAVLRNPSGPDADNELRDLEEAARAVGRQTLIVNAATSANSMPLSQKSFEEAQAGCSSLAVHSFSANADSSWHSLLGMPC